jgi:hypothetical protein
VKKAPPPSSAPQWHSSFGAYAPDELRTVRFASIPVLNRAIDLCWRDPELKGVPRYTTDGRSLIVPREAVPIFKARRLRFSSRKVRSA